MSERSPARAGPRGLIVAVDVALFTPRGSDLAVLLLSAGDARRRGRDRFALPSTLLRADESPDAAAGRAAKAALGAAPSWLEQAETRACPRGNSDAASITVCYFGLAPAADSEEVAGASWVSLGDLPPLDPRPRDAIATTLGALRARVDDEPIAFRLLPASFTLSELQTIYELLLGRRLHKASFRRSLHASALVEATDEWRSEGRGRPAQLFRYAPRRRRRTQRGIRFDLL